MFPYQQACESAKHVGHRREEKVLGGERGEVVAGSVHNLSQQESKDWSNQKRFSTVCIRPLGKKIAVDRNAVSAVLISVQFYAQFCNGNLFSQVK